MTVITPLASGAKCIKMTLSDGTDEVRVHLHQGEEMDGYPLDPLTGLLIKNASMGVLYEEGDVVGDCG